MGLSTLPVLSSTRELNLNNVNEMKLIYERTGEEVKVEDRVKIGKGWATVKEFTQPHKPSSTGRVYVKMAGQTNGNLSGFFPSVIGAKWIEREDRNPSFTVTVTALVMSPRGYEDLLRHGRCDEKINHEKHDFVVEAIDAAKAEVRALAEFHRMHGSINRPASVAMVFQHTNGN